MTTRSLATVGMTDEATLLLKSMLNIAHGRTRCAWQLSSDPKGADVVLVGDGDHRALDLRPRASQRVVAVTSASSPRPTARYTLLRPFRVMLLLSLLDELHEDLADGHAGHAQSSQLASASDDLLASLRALAGARPFAGWLVSTSSDGDQVWVTGDGAMFTTAPSVHERLRAVYMRFNALVSAGHGPPAEHVARHPIEELVWFLAMHGSVEKILLRSVDVHYRLRAWPNFGRFGAKRWELQLAARLSRQSMRMAELTSLAGQPTEAVARFLAACEAANILVSATTRSMASAASPDASPNRTGLTGLIAGLRAKMGWLSSR